MSSNKFIFGRRKTLGIEPKNEEKVHIKIPLETGGFWEKEYLQDDLISNVIRDFKEENHTDIPQNYLMDWSFKNKSLNMNDKIKSLLVQEIPTICLNPEIKKKPLEIQNEEIIPKIVGKPFNNPFEIYIFKKSDKILKIQTYDEKIIEDLGLNHYSSSSAYCNGNNKLFISGGETKDNEIINGFWEIDLENNIINEPKIIAPKKDHSMIFIPPKYVFMVGGNDKKTYYYDSELKEIYYWANLNEERTEPALQRIGNILYCFENVNKPNNEYLTFEKTQLNSNNPKWDLIYPKFDQSLSNDKLPQKFFAVSKDSDNSIIFLGGNMDIFAEGNKLVNYKYNPDTNFIEPTDVFYRDYNFKEKAFLPYNKNIDYILPDFNKQHPEVVFYVRNKSKVEKVDYKPNFELNKKKVLRGPKRPLNDSKYDFNMPSIIFPAKPSNNYNLNINEDIKLKAEPKKYISPYAIKDINEPTFQKYDYNYNNKIEQPPPFKEPEIEANKGDQRLSIEIPNDIIESTRVKEREREREVEKEKKEIDFNIQIKEEEKNEEKKIENKNAKIQLRYVPRPPKNYNRQIYTNNPLEQNEVIIPKFHYSVNDPGNELIITRRGKVYTSYVPRQPTRIKSSYADLNIKTSILEKDDLILPNYNYSVNLNMDNEYRSKSPGNLGMSARNMQFSGNMDGDVPTPNIHLPKSGNVNLNAITSNSPDYKFSGNNPGINIKDNKINTPSANINIKSSYSPDYEMSGFIPGTKSQKIKINGNTSDYIFSGRIPGNNIKGNEINIKGPKINSPDYSLSGMIPGVNIKGPKVEMKSSNANINSPNLKINGVDINNKKIDLKGPNFDIKGPIFKEPNYSISGKVPEVDIDKPKINLKGPNMNLKGPNINPPDYNISGKIPGVDIDKAKIDLKGPNIDLKGPNINPPDYNISGKIPGVNIDKPKIDLKGPNIDLKGPNINPPDYNISGKIPGVDIDKPKIDLKGPNIDLKGPNIDLNGPNLKGPDFNLSGKIPGIELDSPKIDLKGPDYKLEGNIDGINANTPKIDMPSGKINLKGGKIKNPEYNLEGNIPGVKMNKPKIDIPKPNINIKGSKTNDPYFKISGIIPGIPKSSSSLNIKGTRRSPDYNLKANLPEANLKSSKLRLESPDINIKGTRKIPEYDINANKDISGIIPGFNLKGSNKVDLPSGNINLKGTKINGSNFDLKGNIPGVKINSPNIDVNGPDYNLKGDIPGIKLNAPKINLNSPNLDMKDSKIEGPNYNLKGDIPGIKINVPKVDIKSPNIDLKGSNYDLNGNIPGVNLNTPKVDVPSGNLNLRGPNIKSPNINVPDYNLSGSIPGAKINGPKLDINTPKINLNGPKADNIISGIIPGSKSYKGGLNVNRPNINLKGPNINKPNIDFGGKLIASSDLNGNIPGMELNGPKVNLNSPNIDLKGPKIEESDYNLKGNIPGVKINVPKVDIKNPNIDLKGPNYDLNGNIQDINVNTPKIDMPSGNINLRGPNLNLKESSNYNLSGNISGMKINPKLDIPSSNINIKGPKIKEDNYELSGKIPGIHSNKQDYTLSGIIPSYRNKSPNIEINNYRINQPDIKYSINKPNINLNNNMSQRNLKVSINKGVSPVKKNFHGSINDPNYLDYSDIKGSRRVLFTSQIDDMDNSKKIYKNKLDISGIKIIDEKDVILQEPYNIDKQALLHGPKIQTNRKNINLVVSHHEIQPEMDFGQIKTRQANINLNTPNLELNKDDIKIDKNIDLKGGDIDINMNNNIGNLGNIDFKLNNNEENKEIKINAPKIEINNDLELEQDYPKIDIENPKLEGKINLTKKDPTNLRFKPIRDEEDKKFGINLKFNVNENDEEGSNDENNTKVKNSERGNFKKRGKGLPMVGIKTNNFKSSKIDVAGKLDIDNIDVNNMKSANVGVNGVKLGERIIE